MLQAVVTPKAPAPHSTSHVRKALIVCPSTLLDNWAKEIRALFGTSITPVLIRAGNSESKSKFKGLFSILLAFYVM